MSNLSESRKSIGLTKRIKTIEVKPIGLTDSLFYQKITGKYRKGSFGFFPFPTQVFNNNLRGAASSKIILSIFHRFHFHDRNFIKVYASNPVNQQRLQGAFKRLELRNLFRSRPGGQFGKETILDDFVKRVDFSKILPNKQLSQSGLSRKFYGEVFPARTFYKTMMMKPDASESTQSVNEQYIRSLVKETKSTRNIINQYFSSLFKSVSDFPHARHIHIKPVMVETPFYHFIHSRVLKMVSPVKNFAGQVFFTKSVLGTRTIHKRERLSADSLSFMERGQPPDKIGLQTKSRRKPLKNSKLPANINSSVMIPELFRLERPLFFFRTEKCFPYNMKNRIIQKLTRHLPGSLYLKEPEQYPPKVLFQNNVRLKPIKRFVVHAKTKGATVVPASFSEKKEGSRHPVAPNPLSTVNQVPASDFFRFKKPFQSRVMIRSNSMSSYFIGSGRSGIVNKNFKKTLQGGSSIYSPVSNKYYRTSRSVSSNFTNLLNQTTFKPETGNLYFKKQREIEREFDEIKKMVAETKKTVESASSLHPPSAITDMKKHFDIKRISDQVYHDIERRLRLEKERRGL